VSLRSVLLFALVLLPLHPAAAASITLYDDSQSLPGTQAWLFAADDGLLTSGTATQSAFDDGLHSGVNLVTDNAVSAGYSNHEVIINLFPAPGISYSLKNPAFPELNRNLGFSLEFELQVLSENHLTTDRAGFSVLLLAQDLSGIEIGFWQNEVWAQNTNFTHGETQVYDTTLAERLYELAILDDTYTLSVGGNPLLSGVLRDYSNFGTPYNLSNFLFLGDDTSSARANVNIGQITLNTNEPASVPAPTGALLLLTGLPLLRQRLNRRQA